MRGTQVLLLSATLAMPSLAQTNGTFLFTSSNNVSLGAPFTTIGVWAAWDDPENQLQFSGGDYDLTANEGEFFNAVNVRLGPGSSTGVIVGNMVFGAVNGGTLLPNMPPPPGVQSPTLLATYDWTTTDFTPRTVDLWTSNTTAFILGDWRTGGFIELFPNNFTPGSGIITVVPAPAAWVAIALPLVARRRRRG
jgi:hypothetical protein